MWKGAPERGIVAVGAMTTLSWNVWYRNQPIWRLAEMIRRDWEMAAAHGVTAFGSRVHNPRILSAVSHLSREETAPIRFMALMETHRRPSDPDAIRQLYRMTGNFTGMGDDMMWFGGVASELWDSSFPQVCLGPDVPASPSIKIREKCPQADEMYSDTLQYALEVGWRLAGVHGVGSHGVRLYIQMIEMAMKNSGMTVEDIRKLRLTTEHAEALGTPPDVMAKLKEYGIIVSANPPRLRHERDYLEDYGPAVEPFLQPVKTWLDMGINVVGQFEGYRSIGSDFNLFITRVVNGRDLLPEQKLDRVTVLKMWTHWAAYYLMKEKDLGTLEVGKLADLVILDKDFFTIPTEQIPKIIPQMTMVDGKSGIWDSTSHANWGWCGWGMSLLRESDPGKNSPRLLQHLRSHGTLKRIMKQRGVSTAPDLQLHLTARQLPTACRSAPRPVPPRDPDRPHNPRSYPGC